MSFYRETVVAAVRKPRSCYGCCRQIETGEPAVNCAGKYDGEFWSATYHDDCRKAEIALNDLHDTYPDEWMNLGADMEWEDWPWLIEKFPDVAARMNITTARFEEIERHHEEIRRAFLKVAKARGAA